MSLNRPVPPVMGQVSALPAMDCTTLTASLMYGADAGRP
jgi:hypothetical protein